MTRNVLERDYYAKLTTYEFLVLATILDLDVGLLVLADDLEGEVLHVCLHLRVVRSCGR